MSDEGQNKEQTSTRHPAPQHRARDGESRSTPVPRLDARDRAADRGRLLLRHRRGREAALGGGPAGDRRGDAEDHRCRRAVRQARGPARRRHRREPGPGREVQGRDRRGAAGGRGHLVLRHGIGLDRPVPRAARALHQPHQRVQARSPWPGRTGAATRSARCSSGSTGQPGRPRRISTSTSGGWRRPAGATTGGIGRDLDLFSVSEEVGRA